MVYLSEKCSCHIFCGPRTMLDAQTQKCPTPGPCSPRVSCLIQQRLQGNEATVDVMGVLMNPHMYQTLGLWRSEDQNPEFQVMEGCMQEADLGPSIGQWAGACHLEKDISSRACAGAKCRQEQGFWEGSGGLMCLAKLERRGPGRGDTHDCVQPWMPHQGAENLSCKEWETMENQGVR